MKVYKSPAVSGVRCISPDFGNATRSVQKQIIEPVPENNQRYKEQDHGALLTKPTNVSEQLSTIPTEFTVDNVSASNNKVPDAIIESEKIDHEKILLTDQVSKLKDDNSYLQQALNAIQIKEKEEYEIEFNQARQRGYDEGRQQAIDEFNEIKNKINKLIEELNKNISNHILNTKPIISEVVFSALCRVLGGSYKNDVLVTNIIDTVLREIRDDVNVRILISESDYGLLNSSQEKINEIMTPRIKLVVDQKVSSGGCIIESDIGRWDGRLETQLQRFKELLLDAGKGEME